MVLCKYFLQFGGEIFCLIWFIPTASRSGIPIFRDMWGMTIKRK